MARTAAETANQAKTQILANMSHALRTRLHATGGYVQLLEMGLHGPVTADQGASLGRVQTAQHGLLALMNDALNYAKLESGRIKYDVCAVDVCDVIADVVLLIEPQMAAEGLAFAVHRPDTPCIVWADRDMLGQVLVNVLASAAKSTDTRPVAADAPGRAIGRVRVDLTTCEPGPDGEGLNQEGADGEALGAGRCAAVYVRVTEAARGIRREKQDAIVDPFMQVRTGYARDRRDGLGAGDWPRPRAGHGRRPWGAERRRRGQHVHRHVAVRRGRVRQQDGPARQHGAARRGRTAGWGGSPG